jgi:O-antigen/teichoic acid export membrane protein
MMGESLPLMLNHLLATIYWRLGVWILYDFAGAAAVGIFSAGGKYLDGINVIPAYFTLAIFPLMSRHARSGSDGVVKAYRLAVQLLVMVALPVAVFVTFAATPLIKSIPIGFINSVTQYALIAVGQQRFLTRAFIIGVVCTAAANLILVPRLGYLAAAIAVIPAELSLFLPFGWAVRRYIAPVSWLKLCGVPLLAALLDAGAVAGLNYLGVPLLLSLTAGIGVYLLALGVLGTFRNPDFALLWSQLHVRMPWQRRLQVEG